MNSKSTTGEPIGVRLPPNAAAEITRLAAQDKIGRSQVMRNLIYHALGWPVPKMQDSGPVRRIS
jgi:Ribbon-helix-helix protein, copG family